MSEISVGSVSVDVVPDASRFPARVRREITPEAKKIGEEFSRIFGAAATDGMARGVREGLRQGGGDAGRQGAKLGDEYAGGMARAFKARIEAALRNLPEVKLTADSSAADQEIARVRENLEALRDKRIGIDIDAAEATARLDSLQRDLQRLSQEAPDIQVRVDSGAAAAELARFQAEVARLDGRQVDVEVDVDTAAASAQLALLNSQARGAGGGFGALLGAALLLGPALIPVGAAGAGAMAAIATGALAAVGGLGVLILALAPVIAAVQAVRAAHDKSAQSARGSTGAHLQMVSAIQAVTTAQRGLASAEEDARIARVHSDEAVADARRSLADAVREAARQQVDAARDVEDAEQGLADAQRDSLTAQRALSDAREEAARAMEDLSSRVARGALDEEEATLRLAEARQRAAEVQADPGATELERQRAQLAVAQAIQGLKDQQTENVRLAEEKAKADKAGVAGSTQVQQAQERVREAHEHVRDAQQGVSDAVDKAARSQQDGAARVAAAQRGVADAVRTAADQQRKSAEAIISAQAGVVAAQRGVQQASQSAGAAGGSAFETMQQKLDALSPAGRRFVDFVTGDLLPALKPLGDTAQTAVLPGLQKALTDLMPALPGIQRLISSLGGAIGDLAVEAVESFNDPVWKSFFGYLQSDGADILKTIGRTVGNVAEGFAGLVVAFKPVTDQVLDGILRLSRGFADFSSNASPDSGLGKFIGYVQDNGPKVVETFADIGRAVGHILESLAPLGPVALAVVDGFAKFIHAIPAPVLAGIVVGLGALAIAFSLLSTAATIAGAAFTLAEVGLLPIILTVGAVVAVIAGLTAGLVVLYRRNEDFRNAVDIGWAIIKQAISTAWTQVIRPAFQALHAFVTDNLLPAFKSMFEFFGRIAGPALDLLKHVPGPAGDVARALGDINISALAAGEAAGLAGSGIDGMGNSAKTAEEKAKLLKQAQDDLAEASKKLSDAVLAARDAENGYEAATDAASAALKENGKTLDVHTEKGRRNREALDSIAESANRYTQQLTDNGVSQDTVKTKMEAARKKLIEQGEQFGLTREEARKYADKVLAIPKEASTEIKTPGAAKAKQAVDDMKKSTDDLGDSAGGIAGIFKAMWDSIREAALAPVKFVVETVLNNGIIAAFNKIGHIFGVHKIDDIELPKAFFHADGGYISGPGGPREDLIPAMLSNGEFVINAAATARNLELLKYLNGGGSLGGDPGGVARFATGGLVRDTVKWLPSVDPLPYVWGGVGPHGYDCSGLSSEVLNRVLGRQSYHRNFTTSSDLRQSGFAPGFGMFTVGVNPGEHMVGTLSGLGFEARSTATGIFVGPSATDPLKMQQQWYLASLPGGKVDDAKGFDWKNPFASVTDLFSGVFDGFDQFKGPWADLVIAMPHRLVDAAGDFLSDSLPGFADGGLVTKYDEGGYLPPGLTTVLNATGKPEPVFTGDQWRQMRSGGDRPPVTINQTVNYPAPEVPSVSLTRSMRTAARFGLLQE